MVFRRDDAGGGENEAAAVLVFVCAAGLIYEVVACAVRILPHSCHPPVLTAL